MVKLVQTPPSSHASPAPSHGVSHEQQPETAADGDHLASDNPRSLPVPVRPSASASPPPPDAVRGATSSGTAALLHARQLSEARRAHAELDALTDGRPGAFEVQIVPSNNPVELADFSINCDRLSRSFALQTRCADLLQVLQRPDVRTQFSGQDWQTELAALEGLGASGLLRALGEAVETLSKIAIANNNEARHNILQAMRMVLPEGHELLQVHAGECSWAHHADVVGACAGVTAQIARTGEARQVNPFDFLAMVWFSWSEVVMKRRIQESADVLRLPVVHGMMQRMRTENHDNELCISIIEAALSAEGHVVKDL